MMNEDTATKQKIKKFTDLKVWQEGRRLVKNTYRACYLLPESEKFGLSSQMKRASISVPHSGASI